MDQPSQVQPPAVKPIHAGQTSRGKMIFVVVTILLVAFIVWMQRSPREFSNWDKNLPKAIAQAKAEHRKVLVYFVSKPPSETARWVMQNILSKPDNKEAMAKANLIRVVVYTSPRLNSQEALDYKIRKLPTMLLLDDQGKEINRREERPGEVEFRKGFLDCSNVQKQ